MWRKRSPRKSERLYQFISISPQDRRSVENHLDSLNPTSVANAQGGEHRRRVIVGAYPMVAPSVGKKALNDNETTMLVSAMHSHQTFQSESANNNPVACPFALSVSSSSTTPSSSIRSSARARSWGVSHRDGDDGKSGNTKIALRATITVSVPSM